MQETSFLSPASVNDIVILDQHLTYGQTTVLGTTEGLIIILMKIMKNHHWWKILIVKLRFEPFFKFSASNEAVIPCQLKQIEPI